MNSATQKASPPSSVPKNEEVPMENGTNKFHCETDYVVKLVELQKFCTIWHWNKQVLL